MLAPLEAPGYVLAPATRGTARRGGSAHGRRTVLGCLKTLFQGWKQRKVKLLFSKDNRMLLAARQFPALGCRLTQVSRAESLNASAPFSLRYHRINLKSRRSVTCVHITNVVCTVPWEYIYSDVSIEHPTTFPVRVFLSPVQYLFGIDPL